MTNNKGQQEAIPKEELIALEQAAGKYIGDFHHEDTSYVKMLISHAYMAGGRTAYLRSRSSQPQLRWTKSSERQPDRCGHYFCKVSTSFPDITEKRICFLTNMGWEHRDLYSVIEWLDESGTVTADAREKERAIAFAAFIMNETGDAGFGFPAARMHKGHYCSINELYDISLQSLTTKNKDK